jgi:hypothetical protein
MMHHQIIELLRRGHANLLCIDPILVYVLLKQMSPASRKRRRKENTVPGGITGPRCSYGI